MKPTPKENRRKKLELLGLLTLASISSHTNLMNMWREKAFLPKTTFATQNITTAL